MCFCWDKLNCFGQIHPQNTCKAYGWELTQSFTSPLCLFPFSKRKISCSTLVGSSSYLLGSLVIFFFKLISNYSCLENTLAVCGEEIAVIANLIFVFIIVAKPHTWLPASYWRDLHKALSASSVINWALPYLRQILFVGNLFSDYFLVLFCFRNKTFRIRSGFRYHHVVGRQAVTPSLSSVLGKLESTACL